MDTIEATSKMSTTIICAQCDEKIPPTDILTCEICVQVSKIRHAALALQHDLLGAAITNQTPNLIEQTEEQEKKINGLELALANEKAKTTRIHEEHRQFMKKQKEQHAKEAQVLLTTFNETIQALRKAEQDIRMIFE